MFFLTYNSQTGALRNVYLDFVLMEITNKPLELGTQNSAEENSEKSSLGERQLSY
jgi:hypothetical protein